MKCNYSSKLPEVLRYDDTDYKDRHLYLRWSTGTSALRDLHDINSTDRSRGFNDKASSARGQIPTGWRFVLDGDGFVKHTNLDGFNDKTSSARWELTYVSNPQDAYVEVFEDKDFKGRRISIEFGRNIRDLKSMDFNDKLSSGAMAYTQWLAIRHIQAQRLRGFCAEAE